MTDKDDNMQIAAPTWKWEWNLNTIVVLMGFVASIAAWGTMWEKINSGRITNASNIERLDARLSALETSSRRLDNHELRITNVEKQATDAATAMRAVETTLNALTTDIRVVREILQRLEAGQNGRSHN